MWIAFSLSSAGVEFDWLSSRSKCFGRIGERVTVPQSHYRFIDETMAENDECTASEIRTLLSAEFRAENVAYSERTIARVRSKLR